MTRTGIAAAVSGMLLASATLASAAQSALAAKNEGPMLFKQYCATCHGLDAKGGGPTAPSLKKAPADLTILQDKGKSFPGEKVVHQITGEGEMTSSHGSREMPVWGRAFRYTKGTPPPELAINRLVEYIKTIQVNK